MSPHAPIAISMGEPAGVGPDLILQLYADRAEYDLPPFIVVGNMAFLAARARRLGLNINFTATTVAEATAQFPVALPVCHVEGLVPDKPGETSPLSGKVVMESIARAVAETLAGASRAVVTAPIHKAALHTAGFKYPGHTEYLAALCASTGGAPLLPVMMLVHEDLRVVPLTIHVPLRDVPGLVTPKLIRETVLVVEHDLRTRFGIEEPKLAITGLNPHAGESGSIGTEDRDIILPAVIDLQHNGTHIDGPFSADTMFHLPNWKKYDAVIAMYHDQALIPIKTIAFDQGVNVTLGLPIVRTSPDHGTAFDLAGTGRASLASMLAALRVAGPADGRHLSQIDDLPPLRDVIARHGLSAKKQLGQNFLLDLNLTSRVARAAGPLEGVTVIEVGPGPGGLTRALLAEGAHKVIAIERDERALPALAEIDAAYPRRLLVIAGDALETDYAALADGPTRIVANLPYNIGTELLIRWLTLEPWPPFYDSLTLMFQREVAERIVAKPGDDAYGRLGVLAGWRTDARIAFNVARNAFTPPPKVTSSVVHLVPKPVADDVRVRDLEAVTKAAFGQRRKMVRQSLKSTGVPVDGLLAAAGLKGDERAEELPVEAFLAMAKALRALRG